MVDEERFEAQQATLRTIHDLGMGALSGFAAGFVLGLFLLQNAGHITIPFATACIGAVVVAWALYLMGRERPGVTVWRVLAWVVLALSVGFIGLLLAALDETLRAGFAGTLAVSCGNCCGVPSETAAAPCGNGCVSRARG